MVSKIIESLMDQAAHIEQNLESAEKALVEKDEYIKILKLALDKRDAAIARQKDLIDTFSKKIDTQQETIEKLQSKLETVNNQEATLLEHTKQVCTFMAERDRYKAALADLEGSLAASSDHSKELSAKIHELIH